MKILNIARSVLLILAVFNTGYADTEKTVLNGNEILVPQRHPPPQSENISASQPAANPAL